MFFLLTSHIFTNLDSGQSLWSEFWEAFKYKYLTPDYGEYENFDFGGSSIFTFQSIVICLFIGVNIAAVMAIFNKRYLGDFVRSIMSVDAFTPESAKTLTELGYMKNTTIRSSLKKGVTLKRVVKCVEEQKYYDEITKKREEFEKQNTDPKANFKMPEFKVDFETAHFYIPEDLKYTAETKFDKKGTNWLVFIGILGSTIILTFLLIWLFPDILQLIDNFISIFSGK